MNPPCQKLFRSDWLYQY